MRRLSFLACAFLTACGSASAPVPVAKGASATQSKAASLKMTGPAKSVTAAKPDLGSGDQLASEPPPPPAAAPDEPGSSPNQPEGSVRFVDPTWFRSNMFPDATSVDFKRSEADGEGLFTSQLLFDLDKNASVEDCVTVLETKVGQDVEITRTDEGGRATLKGETDRFRVVMVCGEAKGIVKAYVSFSWTS